MCDTPHHHVCWDYAGGCAVYGCEANAPIRFVIAESARIGDCEPVPTPVAPEPSFPDSSRFWTLAPYLAALLMALVGGSLDTSRRPAHTPPVFRASYGRAMATDRWVKHAGSRPDFASVSNVTLSGPRKRAGRQTFDLSTSCAQRELADTIIRNDRLWTGTGSTAGSRLKYGVRGPIGRILESSLAEISRSDPADWKRLRARVLLVEIQAAPGRLSAGR